jgi:hypothetical protein
MPSSPNYVRDYKQENKTAKARRETGVGKNSGDATRHRARAKVIKEKGAQAVAGKDVGHKKSLKSGGSNSSSNLKVQSVASNRSAGGKSGNKKGKAAGGRKGKKS